MPDSQQSPINLANAIFAELGDRKLVIQWPADGHAIAGRLLKGGNGLKIAFSPDERQYIDLEQRRYHLVAFHFHHPSEHWVDGAQRTVELHVVHQNINDGTLAVVGIFLEPDPSSKQSPKMFDALKKAISVSDEEKFTMPIPTTPAEFLPESPNEYFRYEGSLTTPEFSENVKWAVMRKSLPVAPEVLSDLIEDFGGEARFPQPLNRRFVLATFKSEGEQSKETRKKAAR